MEAWAKIALGLLFLFLSLGYLYRPALILRLNAFFRTWVFDDSYVLLYRRRWGLLSIGVALLFLYSGFLNLAHRAERARPSSYLAMTEAYRAFRAGQPREVVQLCEELLRHEPENVHAWLLLGQAWTALGRRELARDAWRQVLKIDPEHPVGRSELFKNERGDADKNRRG